VDKHTATITRNRPEALTRSAPHLISELRAAYDRGKNDDKVWTLIVPRTGRAFCTVGRLPKPPRDVKVIYGTAYLCDMTAMNAPQRHTPFAEWASRLTAVNGICCGAA